MDIKQIKSLKYMFKKTNKSIKIGESALFMYGLKRKTDFCTDDQVINLSHGKYVTFL
jgi:hypothetical protein